MTRDPNELEREIDQTRNRIESRLNALGNELHPTRVVERAFGTSDMSTSETFEVIADRARRSPISTALIGAGMLGLFLAGRHGREPVAAVHDPVLGEPLPDTAVRPYERDAAGRVRDDLDALSANLSSAGRSVGEAGDRARAQVDQARDFVSETTERVQEAVTGAYASAKDTVSGVWDSASGTIGRSSGAVRAAPVRARDQAGTAVEWVRENPMTAGLMALAAGAAISSVVTARNATRPSTRYEASHELHERAEREEREAALARMTRFGDVEASDSVAAKPRGATRSDATKGKVSPSTVAAPRATSTKPALKNLDRSTAVQGKTPAKPGTKKI